LADLQGDGTVLSLLKMTSTKMSLDLLGAAGRPPLAARRRIPR
jgi:hypothetical protein